MPKPNQLLLLALSILCWTAISPAGVSAQPVIANVPADDVASPSSSTSAKDAPALDKIDPFDEDDKAASPAASDDKAPAEEKEKDKADVQTPTDKNSPAADKPETDKAKATDEKATTDEKTATENKIAPEQKTPGSEPAASDAHANLDEKQKKPEEPAANEDKPQEPAAAASVQPTSPAGDSPAEETAAVDPAPPPQNPVVVALLAKLEELSKQRNNHDDADLEALKSFYSAVGREPLWLKDAAFSSRARKLIKEIRQADDWGLKASAYELPLPPSKPVSEPDLADAELKLSLAALEYARDAAGGRAIPLRVSKLLDLHPELPDPKKLLWSLSSSDAPGALLRDQHPKHPQFEKLRQALLAARAAKKAASSEADETSTTGKDSKTGKDKETASRRKSKASIHQIIANMERWRWMPRDLGDFYVWDDVTAQMTRVVDHGKVVLNEKIVVGKPSTPTPIFSDKMEFVIFHPSWGVPPGMKHNELLPQLRNSGGGWFSTKPLASSVLRAHGLTVTRGGVRVNPDSIDWTTANINNYHFTQPPGASNVLGIVKFRFPNRHNVYMHDTPERNLFSKTPRTFSHGCMRVQNPIHLAEVLLAHDKGWSKAEVKTHKRRGSSVKLTNPIPVHIAYFTVKVDDDGVAHVRRDIYGLDSRVVSAIEGRRVRVGSTKTKVSKRKTQYRRAYNKKKKKKKRTAADWEFNPFRYGQ